MNESIVNESFLLPDFMQHNPFEGIDCCPPYNEQNIYLMAFITAISMLIVVAAVYWSSRKISQWRKKRHVDENL
jgi:hypothetical protein